MRYIALLVTFCFALASCQTTKIDAAIQKNLPQICALAAKGHTAFIIVAATGKVKAKTVAKEAAAYQTIEIVCQNPENSNVETLLIQAAQAYVVITAAMSEAKRVQ